MARKILVAVDGSAQSDRAFIKAVEIANIMGAELHALFVLNPADSPKIPPTSGFGEEENMDEIISRLIEEEADAVLEHVSLMAREEQFEIITHKAIGDAREEIIVEAKQLDAYMIVVGSVGKSRLDRLLLGSVSSFVVENSPIPTLVVR